MIKNTLSLPPPPLQAPQIKSEYSKQHYSRLKLELNNTCISKTSADTFNFYKNTIRQRKKEIL